MNCVALVTALLTVWLLLSGHTEPWLLGLGALSVALSTWLAARTGVIAHEAGALRMLPRAIGYWMWLFGEIITSNITVLRYVLHPRMPIDPQLLRVPASQATELGRVIYANSITLTPGTVSVDLDKHTVAVHALTAQGARDLAAGEMDRRVANLERGS